MSNFIGHSLGRYRILELLGEGGMASVYKALDTRLERDVAIKIIRVGAFPPEQMERIHKRFEREAKALARLSHPNIVKVYDYGEYESVPYLVLEYVPGNTLKQQLDAQKGDPMPWQKAIQLLVPIANALQFAHAQGIIHRDVKPSNILITESGQPKLSDFGIVKLLDVESTHTLTGTGIGVGTPGYIAPEQWAGKATQQSDQYSLGVILYEMVTGRKPYGANTPVAVLLEQATKPLSAPRKYSSDLPDWLDEAILKSLASNPEQRFPNIGEFADTLAKLGQIDDKRTIKSKRKSKKEGMQRTQKNRRNGEMPAAHPARGRRPFFRWGIWASLGGLVIVGGLAILGGNLGRQGIGPLYGLVYPTFSPTRTPTFTRTKTPTRTPTLTPTRTFTPTATFTPTLGIGDTWKRQKDGMKMVYVPKGTFRMGSPDQTGTDNEHPQNTVYLDAFWIDKTDVTNAMYAVCVQAETCLPPQETYDLNKYFGNPLYDNYPVTSVNWYQANTYCHWAGVHLPTEAQWEKAARGTDGNTYPWGNYAPSCSSANFSRCSGEPSAVDSHSAGSSPYGALDMAGNVWQWVEDWYDPKYYASQSSSNPQGPSSGKGKVVRGGSWYYSNEDEIRSAFRAWYSPDNSGGFQFEYYYNSYNDAYDRYGSGDTGFRCARPAN